ncbi:membrane-associated protein, putative [Bodo saltans]|uniref:Membrane-associated protein, putative n=1 Tax=Bodo saltans TaxID=75058 RepID=A0A0S4JDD7_BODSA|nr:membrane-associated protein, putative [Bodo saltans]|eukprot:CUG88440.1 membrane-associated protein, putative [Bodo saltans]
MFGKALLVALAIAVVVEGGVHVGSKAATDCSVGLTPTVTFVTSCATVSSLDAACWTPHAPGADDVVLLPGGTAASIPFEETFTPFSVKSATIAGGAKITMNGGAIVVTECLQVEGTLLLDTAKKIDNGTWTSTVYPADSSVPMVTDCAAVPRGFSPRICGPGTVYVAGSLTLNGLFASLWAQTTVASSAALSFNDESFLWGAVTNYGSISANKRFFFHGSLVNQAGANAMFSELRADFWTVDPGQRNATLSFVNYGSVTFTLPKDYDYNYNYISTKDVNGTGFVTLSFENHNDLLFVSWLRGPYSYCQPWGQIAFDLLNYGSTTWRGKQGYYGIGVATNYGAFLADQSQVGFSNYISDGGSTIATNGGGFNLGLSDAAIEKLKSTGVRGPYISTVILTKSRMSSPDATGTFRLHAPIVMDSGLEISAGATLSNEIPFEVSTMLLPGSNGVITIGGALVTGKKDEMKGKSASYVVLRTGSIVVPSASTTVLHADADLSIEDSGLLHVEGSMITREAKERKLRFQGHVFAIGAKNIQGEFSLDSVLTQID